MAVRKAASVLAAALTRGVGGGAGGLGCGLGVDCDPSAVNDFIEWERSGASAPGYGAGLPHHGGGHGAVHVPHGSGPQCGGGGGAGDFSGPGWNLLSSVASPPGGQVSVLPPMSSPAPHYHNNSVVPSCPPPQTHCQVPPQSHCAGGGGTGALYAFACQHLAHDGETGRVRLQTVQPYLSALDADLNRLPHALSAVRAGLQRMVEASISELLRCPAPGGHANITTAVNDTERAMAAAAASGTPVLAALIAAFRTAGVCKEIARIAVTVFPEPRFLATVCQQLSEFPMGAIRGAEGDLAELAAFTVAFAGRNKQHGGSDNHGSHGCGPMHGGGGYLNRCPSHCRQHNCVRRLPWITQSGTLFDSSMSQRLATSFAANSNAICEALSAEAARAGPCACGPGVNHWRPQKLQFCAGNNSCAAQRMAESGWSLAGIFNKFSPDNGFPLGTTFRFMRDVHDIPEPVGRGGEKLALYVLFSDQGTAVPVCTHFPGTPGSHHVQSEPYICDCGGLPYSIPRGGIGSQCC